jgi:hypothetical protein
MIVAILLATSAFLATWLSSWIVRSPPASSRRRHRPEFMREGRGRTIVKGNTRPCRFEE